MPILLHYQTNIYNIDVIFNPINIMILLGRLIY